MRLGVAALAISAVLWLSGCVTPPDYTNFFHYQPHSILVATPANKTTAVDAPVVFLTTVSKAFAERGYYVFPTFLVHDILNDLGATDEEAIAAIPPVKFKEVFGADSILYITITEWATSYVLLSATVTVGAQYRLVDASTGTVLWTREAKFVYQSGGGGLIGMAVSALLATTVDYQPLALALNSLAANPAGYGIPAGSYHPAFQKDREQFK